MTQKPTNPFLFILGMIFFIVGAIGAFLPLLPTVPFWIVAAALFSKSSPKMEAWILKQPHVGPMILEWREKKIIRKETKQIASLSIVVMVAPSLIIFQFSMILKVLIMICCLAVVIWIFRQRSE